MSFQDEQQKIEESLTQLSWGERMLRSFGPLAGGYLLDVMDLATWGPVGFYLGPVIGGLLGWWLSTVYQLGWLAQLIVMTLTAAYCLMPGTELLPVATIVFALIRFAQPK